MAQVVHRPRFAFGVVEQHAVLQLEQAPAIPLHPDRNALFVTPIGKGNDEAFVGQLGFCQLEIEPHPIEQSLEFRGFLRTVFSFDHRPESPDPGENKWQVRHHVVTSPCFEFVSEITSPVAPFQFHAV